MEKFKQIIDYLATEKYKYDFKILKNISDKINSKNFNLDNDTYSIENILKISEKCTLILDKNKTGHILKEIEKNTNLINDLKEKISFEKALSQLPHHLKQIRDSKRELTQKKIIFSNKNKLNLATTNLKNFINSLNYLVKYKDYVNDELKEEIFSCYQVYRNIVFDIEKREKEILLKEDKVLENLRKIKNANYGFFLSIICSFLIYKYSLITIPATIALFITFLIFFHILKKIRIKRLENKKNKIIEFKRGFYNFLYICNSLNLDNVLEIKNNIKLSVKLEKI